MACISMGLHPNHVIYGLFCRQEAELQIISPLLSIILTYTCAVLNAMKNNKTLQQFCGADCASICKSTGYSLFYMVHGVKPVLSFDLTLVTFLVQNLVEPLSTVDLLATHACQLQICDDDLGHCTTDKSLGILENIKLRLILVRDNLKNYKEIRKGLF